MASAGWSDRAPTPCQQDTWAARALLCSALLWSPLMAYLSKFLLLHHHHHHNTFNAPPLTAHSSPLLRATAPHSSACLHPPFLAPVKFSAQKGKRSPGPVAIAQDPILKQEKPKHSVVVIDNYDSFTYNLCQYLGDLGCEFDVYRNDEISIEELGRLIPRGLLISPGPGLPKDSGISLEVVRKLGPTIPLFGVCMGLQCIGEAFGGHIVRAPSGVMHGKTSIVYYDERGEPGLFAGLPNPFTACRYHSLVIEKESFPSKELEVTAWTMDGLIMGVRHVKYRHIQAVQFHPESIITESGKKIVENFIEIMNASRLQPMR